MSNIYVTQFVVLPRVAKVAEVAWFTGGWGPVILSLPRVVVLAMVAKVGGGGPWLETNIYVNFYVVLPRVVKVAEVAV